MNVGGPQRKTVCNAIFSIVLISVSCTLRECHFTALLTSAQSSSGLAREAGASETNIDNDEMKGFPTNRRAIGTSLFFKLKNITISAVSCRRSMPSAMAIKGVTPTPAHSHSMRDAVRLPFGSKQVNCPPEPFSLICNVLFRGD